LTLQQAASFQRSIEFDPAWKKSAMPVYLPTITGGGHGREIGFKKTLELFSTKSPRGVARRSSQGDAQWQGTLSLAIRWGQDG